MSPQKGNDEEKKKRKKKKKKRRKDEYIKRENEEKEAQEERGRIVRRRLESSFCKMGKEALSTVMQNKSIPSVISNVAHRYFDFCSALCTSRQRSLALAAVSLYNACKVEEVPRRVDLICSWMGAADNTKPNSSSKRTTHRGRLFWRMHAEVARLLKDVNNPLIPPLPKNTNLGGDFQFAFVHSENRSFFDRLGIPYKRFIFLSNQAKNLQGLIPCQPETLLAAVTSLFVDWRREAAIKEHAHNDTAKRRYSAVPLQHVGMGGKEMAWMRDISLLYKTAKETTHADMAEVFSISTSTLLKARKKIRRARENSLSKLIEPLIKEAENAVMEVDSPRLSSCQDWYRQQRQNRKKRCLERLELH